MTMPYVVVAAAAAEIHEAAHAKLRPRVRPTTAANPNLLARVPMLTMPVTSAIPRAEMGTGALEDVADRVGAAAHLPTTVIDARSAVSRAELGTAHAKPLVARRRSRRTREMTNR